MVPAPQRLAPHSVRKSFEVCSIRRQACSLRGPVVRSALTRSHPEVRSSPQKSAKRANQMERPITQRLTPQGIEQITDAASTIIGSPNAEKLSGGTSRAPLSSVLDSKNIQRPPVGIAGPADIIGDRWLQVGSHISRVRSNTRHGIAWVGR